MTRSPAAPLACALLFAIAGCQRAAEPDAQAASAAPAVASTMPAPTTESTPVAAAPATTPTAAPSVFALPGDLHPGMRVEDIEARFGKANVQAGEVPGAEGESVDGAVLFADDPQRRAYLYFDEHAPKHLVLFRVTDAESQWSLDNGLRMRMPLAQIVAINGKPIRFSGLEWDYGGAIQSLGGGRLQAGDKTPVSRAFALAPIVGDDAETADAYPLGEGEFSSDDPHYPRQGEAVGIGELSVSFAEDAR